MRRMMVPSLTLGNYCFNSVLGEFLNAIMHIEFIVLIFELKIIIIKKIITIMNK